MSETGVQQAILRHLRDGGHLSLFLDYDGTLVPIAPTPAEAVPDAELLELLQRLSQTDFIRTIVLSGRPLDELLRMLPVSGILYAGLYGVEVQLGGNTILREPQHNGSRKSLLRIRQGWMSLTAGLTGFLLEDKGQALALHARWADAEQADHVLAAARDMATDLLNMHTFRLLSGDRYLEVAPRTADKGETAEWLLSQFPLVHDLPVCFGDDNKDEEAFAAIQHHGGYAIGVGNRYALPGVDARVTSPWDVREWLRSFLDSRL